MKEELKDTVVISDLLDVVHYTIIKNKGENTIILHELQSISRKIQEGKLDNYPVQGVTFWESIISKLPAARMRQKIDIIGGVLFGGLITTIVYIMFQV